MKRAVLLFAFCVLLFSSACDDTNDEQPIIDDGLSDFTIWSGAKISFSKAAGADPSIAENQDRITEKVWITRGNNGGQIFNAAEETQADKNTSPTGTLWAIGEIEEIPDLDFQPFRIALGKPRGVIGQNLVMKLVEKDAYVFVRITSWDEQKLGGFSYERSTE